MERILKEQGKELATLRDTIATAGAVKADGIAGILKKDERELAKLFNERHGVKSYEILTNSKGEVFMKPYNEAKTAYSHATIDDVDNAANVASIAESLDTASIIRMGANADLVNQYRNTPYIFDLCNTVTTNSPFAIWMDEGTQEGASTAVAEGASKPLSQYFYTLKNSTFKKEATLLTFTEEFSMDFARIQEQAIGNAKTDLVNRINAAIQPRIFAAATAYNTGAIFAPLIADATPNDFDAIAAMAAQANSATFGSANVNAALMSTYKKFAMG
jgi:hypothetical protein